MTDYAEEIARQAKGEEPWSEPIPFGYGGKVPVFPVQRLPLWLQDYVLAMSSALQVPVDLPGLLVLAVLAGAAGGRCVVEVRAGWREPLNLYVAVAMHPGTRKTPVFQRVIKPLELTEREMIELNHRFDLNGGQGGPIAIAADYLETVMVRA